MRPVTRLTDEGRHKGVAWRVDALERRPTPSSGQYEIKVFPDDGMVPDPAPIVTVGDGKFIFVVPFELNEYFLHDAQAFVTTASSSGDLLIQIRNVTDGVDMLSTRITIEANEFTSYAATVDSVINYANDFVITGDRIAIDVDAAGTGAKGLGVILRFSP